MRHLISPNFHHKKLEKPALGDLIDVFEDRMRNWLLLPAKHLIDTPNGLVAATALLSGYFEGIEIYLSGKDSNNRSGEFFVKGFLRVFSVHGEGKEMLKKVAEGIYKQLRCGFAHDGMFRYRVFFDETLPKAILVTWPKKNGMFYTAGALQSIAINPSRFYDCIMIHFESYLKCLREGTDGELKDAFEKAVQLKWGIDQPDIIIGMSEEDYRNFCNKPPAIGHPRGKISG